MNNREKGDHGEKQAVEYLVNAGYMVLSCNYRTQRGEIDCIARDKDGTLVFIEVKSGLSTACGHPFFRVDKRKQQKLAMMARFYLAEHRMHNVACRFDVIAVTKGSVDHLRNAFLV